MWAIHGLIGDHFVPLMYANMSERTTQDYNEVLDRLPDLPNLEYFLVDFEFAERHAIERRYPHVQVRTLGFRTFFSFRNLKFYKKKMLKPNL